MAGAPALWQLAETQAQNICANPGVVKSNRMETEQAKFPPPPGLVASLARGFDSVANHVALILPPVLLDLFLWLGPRLRIQQFLQPIINMIPLLPFTTPPAPADLAAFQQRLTDFASHFNLFSVLRTFPVGTPSLLSWSLPGTNAASFRSPANLEAGSFFGVTGWTLLLALVGLLVGCLYYYWVSGAAIQREKEHSLFHAIKQTFAVSLLWGGLFLLVGLPAATFVSLVLQVIPASLVGIAAFLVIAVLIWLALPFFFSPYGIYTSKMNALNAFLSSLHMVRYTLPNTGLFLLAFLIINQGLNLLWNTPSQASWWMLVGIAGHAFVSTALLAASFIYYRDINAWLKTVLEQLQQQANSAKA